MSNQGQFAKLVVEFWKLVRAYERSIPLLPPDHQTRAQAQLRFSANQLKSLLDEVQIVLVTFEGKTFEPNLPMSAVNADDFEDDDNLVVAQSIEPAIVQDGKVLLMGKVVLAKGG